MAYHDQWSMNEKATRFHFELHYKTIVFSLSRLFLLLTNIRRMWTLYFQILSPKFMVHLIFIVERSVSKYKRKVQQRNGARSSSKIWNNVAAYCKSLNSLRKTLQRIKRIDHIMTNEGDTTYIALYKLSHPLQAHTHLFIFTHVLKEEWYGAQTLAEEHVFAKTVFHKSCTYSSRKTK